MQEGHLAQQDEYVPDLDLTKREMGLEREARHTEHAQEVMDELTKAETPVVPPKTGETSIGRAVPALEVNIRPPNEVESLWPAVETRLTSEFDQNDSCSQQEGPPIMVCPQCAQRPPTHLKDYVCHAIQHPVSSPIHDSFSGTSH